MTPFLCLAALATACVYDADHRCGQHQQLNDSGFCVCEPGTVVDAAHNRCAPCGDHEKAAGAVCTCVDGYVRTAPDQPCALANGLADACSVSAPCPAAWPHCQSTGSATGYCTSSGCLGAADCPAGYACATDATGSYCKRPPVGQGRLCTADPDCADSEATLCDNLYTHSCLVQGCTLAPDNCHPGTICCDLTAFNLPKTVCAPLTACPGAKP